jgi:HAE1 family hydrophobic/amphiphilic exporter-1
VGSREITFAAMAASVAIIAIFLPVAFMKGVIGKFFLQFGITISVAVAFSLLEALTITPMRCARFVDSGERTTFIGRGIEALINLITRFYTRTLQWSLKLYGLVLIIAKLIMVFSLYSVKWINKEFSPAQDQSIFLVRVTTPIGSSLEYTDGKMKAAEDYFKSQKDVLQYYSATGGFGSSNETNTGMFFITLQPFEKRTVDPEKHRALTQLEIMGKTRAALKKIPDLKPIIQDLSMRGFTASRGFPIEFTVLGPDWDELYRQSKDLMEIMEKSGMMVDIDTNYLLGMPEVQITPNRTNAALHGVSVANIGETVKALVGGVLVGKYSKNGHRSDIRLQLPKEDVQVGQIKGLMVGNNRGSLIPLSQVVDIVTKPTLQQINRVNRERAISIYANLKPGASQQNAIEFLQKSAQASLTPGYRIEFSGSAQTFKESFESLIFALIMGLIVSYMVLGSQFNSFIDPVTVLMALPFSVSGAFVALLISHQSLNIYSMIGLILLMGIVKKNSILLVDFTNQIRDHEKRTVREALIRACPQRLRPILMTSIATIAGAVPAALAIGPGAETRVPMAIAVIGGVLVSTLLTLYVVPCAYLVFARLQKREHNMEETQKAFELAAQPRPVMT